jgi:hypothetical protein
VAARSAVQNGLSCCFFGTYALIFVAEDCYQDLLDDFLLLFSGLAFVVTKSLFSIQDTQVWRHFSDSIYLELGFFSKIARPPKYPSEWRAELPFFRR